MQMPIRSLQSMLRLLQRHAGKPTTVVPDGIFGPETARAVREFQQQNGLPVTGELDRRTWQHMVRLYAQTVGDGTGSYPVRITHPEGAQTPQRV